MQKATKKDLSGQVKRSLPNPDEHIAVEQETDAAKHLLLGDPATSCQDLADSVDEGFTVGHEFPTLGSNLVLVLFDDPILD